MQNPRLAHDGTLAVRIVPILNHEAVVSVWYAPPGGDWGDRHVIATAGDTPDTTTFDVKRGGALGWSAKIAGAVVAAVPYRLVLELSQDGAVVANGARPIEGTTTPQGVAIHADSARLE